MRANLVDLDADVVRRMLETSPSLTGRTAEAWATASQQFADLWQCQLALDAVLATVTAERGTRASISRSATRRIMELLDGTPVVVAELRPEVGRRTLTAGLHPEVSCSIDDTIARMSVAYDGVVSVVAAVGVVWTELLAELDDLDTEIDRLANQGTGGGSPPPTTSGGHATRSPTSPDWPVRIRCRFHPRRWRRSDLGWSA